MDPGPISRFTTLSVPFTLCSPFSVPDDDHVGRMEELPLVEEEQPFGQRAAFGRERDELQVLVGEPGEERNGAEHVDVGIERLVGRGLRPSYRASL